MDPQNFGVGVAPAALTIIASNGVAYQLKDLVNIPWYGSAFVQQNQTANVDFTSAIAGTAIPGTPNPGPTAVLSDVNLERVGSQGLSVGNQFLCEGLGIRAVRVTGATAAIIATAPVPSPTDANSEWGVDITTLALIDTCFYMKFVYGGGSVNGFVEAEGTLYDFPPGSGPWTFDTRTNTSFAQPGRPDPRAGLMLSVPLVMDAGINFGFIAQPTQTLGANFAQAAKNAGGANKIACLLKVLLYGRRVRPTGPIG